MSKSNRAPADVPGEILYKVLIIGESAVGKTCLIRRYVHNTFQSGTRTTLGVDFALKVLSDQGKNMTIQLWDIAGQEGQRANMTRIYFASAVGAIVVASADDLNSFDVAINWKKDLDGKVFLPNGEKVPCILMVNKCDVTPCPKSKEEMRKFCAENGFLDYFETSAKKDINVAEGFGELVKQIQSATTAAAPAQQEEKKDSVNMKRKNDKKKEGGCPC